MKTFFFAFFIFINSLTYAQSFVNVSIYGAKPKISINGDSCAIQNQQFSCVARTCDSVIIYEGDSISFCTDANIDLTTDTAYYMQWDFNGSSNFTSSEFDSVPSNLPICYYPVWTTAGSYTADIYYNGFLSAYPSSDCYPVPSHWIVGITVLPVNGIEESQQNLIRNIFPNPATEELNINFLSTGKGILELYSVTGKKIQSYEIENGINKINLSEIDEGIYFYKVSGKGRIISENKIIVTK